MNLRGKMLIAQLPMVISLAVAAGGALYGAVRFGSAPGEILYENFRSFDAGRAMLHIVDRIDQRLLSAALQGEPFAVDDVSGPVASFARELRLQQSNITEVGENSATEELRRAWGSYRDQLGQAAAPGGLGGHRQRSQALRDAVEAILQLNRDAMRRKSDHAQREAERIEVVLAALAILSFVLAIALSGAWIRRSLAPVRVLERAVHRMSEGDLDARIRIQGSDEIASLSTSVNIMAERLAQYRQSSLGELLEANNRLESVMDSLADVVVVYDLNGAPVAFNEVATRLLGADRLGLDMLPDALHDVVRDVFDDVRRTGEPNEPASIEAAVEIPGTPAPRWIVVSATPVRTREDALAGITIALRDVTRSRRIEGFKGDLVAAAAHELRTPLTSLHMAVHLCLEQAAGPITDRQQDLLAAARQDCERLQSVVDELLEMARLESGAARLVRAEVNVGELVRDAAARHEAHARQRGKTLEIIPGDSLITIEADVGRVRHVLDNLIDNALLHADTGGRVAIGFERDDGSVRVYFDDDGPGIPEELRERVFMKFFRVPGTLKRGSGLGLSIVQDIVRAHGGEVGTERSPLGGARFWFSIPLASATPEGS